MARKKGPVIGSEEDPKPEEAAPGTDSLETPSGSFDTSSTTSTCPHCNSAFQDMPITDFRDHVASCTRPSTAEDDATSGSSLTTPPASPSQLPTGSASVNEPEKDAEDIEEEIVENDEVPQLEPDVPNEPAVDEPESKDDNAAKDPPPYINPRVDFDYYDQSEPQEGSDGDQNPPEPIEKFPFPKVTDGEIFEEYLKDSEDMTYEELYRRTAIVSDNLLAYQTEWDAIDKEIFEHETFLRSEERRVEEETKAALEEDRLREDEERDIVEKKYKDKLRLSGKKWQEFLAEEESTLPAETMRHLQNLRNPQFMAAARKKQRTTENKNKRLLNAPWPETKKTKEDLELERRQRGRYMDPVKFDDMKQADVYGFEYSAHIKHYGQQPMSVMARQVYSNSGPTSNPLGDDLNDASRTRTQRKVTRKVYEAEASATPEDSEEDSNKLPLKRSRKPKIFIDGVETSERSRGHSRSGTPAVRTFASGKRVGRPPAKSKLQAVQLAQPSETPEVASGSDAQILDGAEGFLLDNGAETRELAPSQEAQLHDAAESLVNQTHTDNATVALPVVKPKHAGGRPRKHPLPVEAQPALFVDTEAPVLKPKPKPKKKRRGRRVKKEIIPEDDLIQLEENGVLQSTEQDDGSQYISAATTRPTSSDSNATFSTIASRRSGRQATRDKTNAREARVATNRRWSTIIQEPASLPTSRRGKRKRHSSDTDPSPIVVEPLQIVDPPTKKRRTRGKQDSDDMIEALPESIPEVFSSRSKRKRGNTINDSISVIDHAVPFDLAPAPKKRRRGAKVEEKEEPDIEEEDSDAGIDEDSLDPIAREALRKKRVKKEKSRKLSRNMKARWANGGMKEAQETRRANNAIKRAHKEQTLANEAAGLPPPPPPVLLGTAPNSGQAPAPAAELDLGPEAPIDKPATATPDPAPKAAKKKRRNKGKQVPPKRHVSTRAKKPTRLAMGLDGADDDDEDDDELEQQFASEYDHFQALTSPTKPQYLGKRVRKSLVDLSQLMDDTEEDDF